MKIVILFLLTVSNFLAPAFASESHSEASTAQRFGPGKAIEAFDKDQGFKLSEKSASVMGVSFNKLDQTGSWRVPKGAILHLKQSTGVYRKYDGWISFVLVKILKHEGDMLRVTSEDLEPGDEVAVTGSIFLRMIDADLNSGTVDSCAH